MKKNYDIVFVTHMPVFYKVNLYNEINKQQKVFAIFIADDSEMKRGPGFLSVQDSSFDYVVLNVGEFEKRNKLYSLVRLIGILRNITFNKIVLGGWDLLEFWFLVLTKPRKKLCLALESTVKDSKYDGLKGFIKKLFLSNISKSYVSGSSHAELLHKLLFKGQIIITNGVGIIRKPEKKISKVQAKKMQVVYIGRLSIEKNLAETISVFNKFPSISFRIYGDGPEEKYLKSIASENIFFEGKIENNKIESVFLDSDYLILPSNKETWGLVVEEALYFDTLVLLSKSCGVADLASICKGINLFESSEDLIDFIQNRYSLNLNGYQVSSFLQQKDVRQALVYKD